LGPPIFFFYIIFLCLYPVSGVLCASQTKAISQQYATIGPENEAYQPRPCLQTQNKYLWANVFKQCASTVLNHSGVGRRVASATQYQRCRGTRQGSPLMRSQMPRNLRTRAFQACVFRAMLRWFETLHREYLTGDRHTISEPKKVANMLSAKWYCDRWPSIPREEVMASAVDFPHPDDDGLSTLLVQTKCWHYEGNAQA
jgi:hypothetical protein